MLKIKQLVVLPETRHLYSILYALCEDGTLYAAAITDGSDFENPQWYKVNLKNIAKQKR